MTLAEFAHLLTVCTRCGRRGSHRVVLDVIACECGNAWRAGVPLCFDGPAHVVVREVLRSVA
ncbi:MAG: hypothetical protein IT460_06895 [Planctomycetes bacterium]|nr:hypothetical protein [Planctomycetota bacterium]